MRADEVADEVARTQEEMPIVSPVRKKARMQEDKTCASSSRLLTSEQLSLLVQLNDSYSSYGRAGRKWATIQTQMRTSYAELDVKRSSLRDICTRVKKQREIRELTRCREQHEQCSTTIDRLEEVVRREKEDKEVLTVVSEEWRVKSEKLMEEVQLLKKEKAEAEKRAKKQSKQVAKSMEDLETQVKNWKHKTEIANALLKTEKGTSEFLRETLNKE